MKDLFRTMRAQGAGRVSIVRNRQSAPSPYLGCIRSSRSAGSSRRPFRHLLKWNRWWAQHRDIEGYLTWGSNGENPPGNLDDDTRGTRSGAILESGLDNSPMYDDTTFDPKTHLLQFADVGLMSLYIDDCDALANIADTLEKTDEAKELRSRSAQYKSKLETLWSAEAGIFLNKDLHTGKFNTRLSPTNFYPMLAHVATPAQAQTMVTRHLLNPDEFWGEWVIPSIARNDPALQRAELLERPHLGSNELPGVSWPAKLRSPSGPQPTRG